MMPALATGGKIVVDLVLAGSLYTGRQMSRRSLICPSGHLTGASIPLTEVSGATVVLVWVWTNGPNKAILKLKGRLS